MGFSAAEFKSWKKASNARERIVDYLETNGTITNVSIQELCGFTKQQARATIDKMRKENIIDMIGKGKSSKYVLVKS